MKVKVVVYHFFDYPNLAGSMSDFGQNIDFNRNKRHSSDAHSGFPVPDAHSGFPVPSGTYHPMISLI